MKFDFHKFVAIVSQLGPLVLAAVPGGEKIAPLIPVITGAIAEAEQIAGATGAEKKAHVMAIVKAGVETANATGKVTIDLATVQQAADGGIDAVLNTVKAIEGAKKPAA
jgi:hypothetical protein